MAKTRFFYYPSGKENLAFALRQGFVGPDELNQVAKNASIPGPLVAILRGVFLSYFGNQSAYGANFFTASETGGFSEVSSMDRDGEKRK
ncbi:MAG: hypothetical protein Q8R70_07280 [Methanoregula sp.]|nr:hypothetical protein [Methanoregula sp.]